MSQKPSWEVSDRILTIPNVLSFVRLALVPVFLVLLVEGQDVLALVVLAVSGITDFLDGFLARRLDQVTRLGQLLDPAADRLYIFAALLGLGWRELIPFWLVVVIIARDVMLLALAVLLARHGGTALPVVKTGKAATAALFIGLPVLMLGSAVPSAGFLALPIGLGFSLLGALLYWVAGIIYIVQTRRLITRRPVPGDASSDTLEK
ncbi:CDP-diacylglycerol--glycerol-3-phosphate 3-phosphatidyltransferase [Paramicrobacterium humi]|uniref:CDP-diacylglycerol--glycerol-3-phosphate 3-phosphatidyltransferase n=1 Tax=Paramicrobacterium humi TaxID=640635 RepID=A0A1H4TTE3_9MICO|nr:CDP-alcohol phosphatidyltransferase family protein [Microbacterium humi]SEC59786.1 CDP-diacylglycerol--glycerol-3-phosphate 3-phosphatidyltransferase [Microbacterium humi]